MSELEATTENREVQPTQPTLTEAPLRSPLKPLLWLLLLFAAVIALGAFSSQ